MVTKKHLKKKKKMTQSIVSSMKSSEIFKTNQAKTYLPLILDRKIMTIKFIETKIILKEYRTQ